MATSGIAVDDSAQHSAATEAASTTSSVSWGILAVRLIVGVIFMAHGGQKLFGWFGGNGLEATMSQMGTVLGFLVSIGEFFGGLGIIVGFLSRFSAAALIVIMLGAIGMVHGKNGFFLADKGFEYTLALIGLLLPILLIGPALYTIPRAAGIRLPKWAE